MAREIELKLEIDPDDLGRLASLPMLSGPPRIERQISVYYDTPKGRLRRHGVLLRVRQHDGGWTQTIKRTNDGAGLFARDEWESEVQGLNPDLQAIRNSPLKELIKPRQFRHLVPVFKTDVERTGWDLQNEAIELTYDSGRIEAGDHDEQVHELELELGAGDPAELFIAAGKIARRIPVKLGVQSKAERGFALASGKGKAIVKARPLELADDMSVAAGFAEIVTACLRHFRMNELLLVTEHNAEALHQLRVAVRRLRTALWLFKPVAKGKSFDRIIDQLRVFTRELGAARNIDVILKSMKADDPARAQLEKDRQQLYKNISRKLGSVRFNGFILDLVGWAHAGEWRNSKKATLPLARFARKRLDRLWQRIVRRGNNLAQLSEAQLHRLRIDAKKIRYSVEFLRGPLRSDGDEQDQFVKAAEGIQDSLGRLNDLATRRQLLDRPARKSATARHLRSAKRFMNELERTGPYWRKANP